MPVVNSREVDALPLAQPLSPREEEILICIGQALTNRQIAERLFIARSTVKWYIRQIYNKLGVGDRKSAIVRARSLGLLPAEQEVPIKHNLPVAATPFVGREKELVALDKLIVDPDSRIITILGPGGIGKTRLALAAAERQLSATALAGEQPQALFKDGVFFVSLTPVGEAENIVPALAAALEFQLPWESERTARQQLVDYLQDKRILLVLDNFEHLLGGRDLLVEIAERAAGVVLLVTSRERLQLSGEQLFPIEGLDVPLREGLSETELVRFSATKLFMNTARRLQPEFRLTEEDLPPLLHICRLTEGMPLGLELAAAWVPILRLSAIALAIERSLNFLTTELHDVPERHRSMQAALGASWARLDSGQQLVFQKLTVFRGGFTRAAALTVAGADLPLLAALVSKSWLTFDQESDRYQVHELLRQFGRRKLSTDAAAEQEVLEKHSAFYLHVLRGCEKDLRAGQVEITLTKIKADIGNVQLSWQRAVDHGNISALGLASFAVGTFYLRAGRYQEGLAAFRRAVEAADRRLVEEPGLDNEELKALARLMAFYTELLFAVNALDEAVENALKALSLLERPALEGHDTRLEKARVLLALGRVYEFSDRMDRASAVLEESVSLFDALGDHWGLADATHLIGGIALRSAAYKVAIERMKEARKYYSILGDRRSIAYMDFWIGACQTWLWPSPKAKGLIEQSLVAFREVGDPSAESWALYGLGTANESAGDFGEAHASYMKAIELCNEHGMQDRAAGNMTREGLALVHLGNYERAISRTREALARPKTAELRHLKAFAMYVLGSASLARSKHDEAREIMTVARAILREIGWREEETWTGAILSCALLLEGQMAQAKQALLETLELALDVRVFSAAMHALSASALLLVTTGDARRAVEVWALACRQRFVANSRLFGDVIGARVEAASTGLPSESRAAAKEKGRSLDVWQTVAALRDELRA